MKTFEERYTAWIDGELEGNALVAFEQELERRAAVSEAQLDKADALRLSSFLHEHLQAPVLTNADFFNHQLRERIAGERASMRRPERERAAVPTAPLFAWSLSRLAWLGAACLFISGALYYGMIPKQGAPGMSGGMVASNQTPGASAQAGSTGAPSIQTTGPADPAASSGQNEKGTGPAEFANLTKEQQAKIQRDRDLAEDQEKLQRQRAMIEPGSDIQARVPDQTVPATVTPLHYKDSNVNVLWVNGLDYLPDASALNVTATPAAAPAATDPAAKATATP